MSSVAALVAGIAIGGLATTVADDHGVWLESTGRPVQDEAAAQGAPLTPLAYVIVGGRVLDAEGLGPYAEKAGPPAQAAGVNVLARTESTADLVVVEGKWPYEGFLAIETFNSMEEFEAFWASAEYQEAIELREGKVELDFVVALPGVAAE